MKLIPLSDFVLEQHEKAKNPKRDASPNPLELIVNYTRFLKQPLKLEFFLPCGQNGNVLESPIHSTSTDLFLRQKKKFFEAKEKVLFNGVLSIDRSPYKSTKRILIDLISDDNNRFRIYTELQYHSGEIDKQYFPNNQNLIIEDIIKFGLTLTPSALQAIGIKEN